MLLGDMVCLTHKISDRLLLPPTQCYLSFKWRTACSAALASWAGHIYLDPVAPRVDGSFLQPTI